MRKSLSGSLVDMAALFDRLKLKSSDVRYIFVSPNLFGKGISTPSVRLRELNTFIRIAKEARIKRDKLVIKPQGNETELEFSGFGVTWRVEVDTPQEASVIANQASELIGIDGRVVAKLPPPKPIALPAPKPARLPAPRQPSLPLFGGDYGNV